MGSINFWATVSLTVAALSVAILLYFVPAQIAKGRHHHNTKAITALNAFLGWTFIGWVAALVWALTNPAPASASSSGPAGRYCSACGAGLSPGSKFCPGCGTAQ